MEEALPQGFTPLLTATETQNKNFNVIGIITDYLPPRQTAGTDWQLTVSINDGDGFGSGHRLKYFRREHELPPIERLGDVVVLKNVQYKSYRSSVNFLSNRSTECTVFPADKMPEKKPEDGTKLEYKQDLSAKNARFVPDEALMKYAWSLWEYRGYEIKSAEEQLKPSISNDAPFLGKQGFKLLEKVGDGGFFDFTGQVVKLWDPQNSSGVLTMYFTDYTSHSLFYNYAPIGEAEGNDGDEHGYLARRQSGWQGPLGQFTITIDLWDAHAAWCRQHLSAKDYVRLRNVNITTGKDGGGKLEGKMRADRNYPGKVNVEKIKQSELRDPDDELKDLLLRKKDYSKQFGNWEKNEDLRGKKRKANEQSSDQHSLELKKPKSSSPEARHEPAPEQQKQPLTKAAKKRQRQKAKALEAATNARKINASDDSLIPKPRAQIRAEYDKLNVHVATSHQDQPVCKVADIMNHKARRYQFRNTDDGNGFAQFDTLMFSPEVRIIDYHPRDLRDFAFRERVSEFDCLRGDDDDNETEKSSPCSPVSDSSDDQQARSLPGDTDDEEEVRKSHRWVWRFSLLVQDRDAPKKGTPERLVLHVQRDGATYLLRGLEPCNLRKPNNEQTLAQLQYKLSILWGNLQEKKEEAWQEAQKVDSGTTQQATPSATSNNALEAIDALHARRPWISGLTNRPFRCCVMEYGTRNRSASADVPNGKIGKPRWSLRYQMFDTTIKS